MGRFKGNDATRGLQGNVGDFYNYRQVNGKTVTTRQVGKREKPGTTAQEVVRERFLEATIYAKGVMADEVKAAIYRDKAGNGKSIYNLAVSDYCVSPTIKRIDMTRYQGLPGDIILIRAVDDFNVDKVTMYIVSTATDLPGNTGSLEVTV